MYFVTFHHCKESFQNDIRGRYLSRISSFKTIKQTFLALEASVLQVQVINICSMWTCLTSEPGGAVGFGGRSVDPKALAGQHVAVLWFLHQEAQLCQQAVQEARQHGRPSDHHQVLRQDLTGVYGALKHTQYTHTLTNNSDHLHTVHSTVHRVPQGTNRKVISNILLLFVLHVNYI